MRIMRKSSGKLPLMVIVVAALVICVAGGAFAFLKMRGKLEIGGGEAKQGKKVELSTWQLEEFVVNLADRGEPRYLKLNLVLEVEGGKAKHGEGGANPEEARARDAVITVVTRKRYSDLISEDGKARLKAEIKSALNEALEGTKVANIYFTSFAMQ